MPGRLTASQLVQVRKADARVFPVLKVIWPGTGAAYYTTAGSPISSARFGTISPQVEQWDDITYKIPDYRGGRGGAPIYVNVVVDGAVIARAVANQVDRNLPGGVALTTALGGR